MGKTTGELECSAAEEAGYQRGLRDALRAVKENADAYERKGLSPFSFWLGVLNLCFSAFILGFRPQMYWIWQTVKSAILLPLGYQIKLAKKKQLYFLDFCWMFAIMYTIAGFASIFEHLIPAFNSIYKTPPRLMLGFWGIANGPLGWSVIVLSNALVLHDPEYMSSLFIHISPVFVAWAIRWRCDDMLAQWPELFEEISCDEKVFNSIGFWDIIIPALSIYFAWWIPFSLWMIFWGRFESFNTSGRDCLYFNRLSHQDMHSQACALFQAVYYSTLETNSAVRRVVGIAAAEVPTKFMYLKPTIIYLFAHAVIVTISILTSYLSFHNMILHTSFCVALLMYCTWLGAIRYNKMMTLYFTKAVESLTHRDFKKKE